MKVKITKIDKLASLACRKRDGYRCRRCGRQHKENSTGLHAAHIVPRRNKNTRWLLDNLLSLCLGCHRWFDENKLESVDWLKKQIGEEKVNWLRVQSLKTWDKDTYKWEVYLKEELK